MKYFPMVFLVLFQAAVTAACVAGLVATYDTLIELGGWFGFVWGYLLGGAFLNAWWTLRGASTLVRMMLDE